MALARRIAPIAPIAATGDRPARWQDNRRVVTLTAQLLALHRRSAARFVDAVIAIGRTMTQVRGLLPHGQWEKWVATAVPFARKTVANYMALAQWADTRPADIERLAHLGPTKLYLLAPLTPSHRRTVTTRKPQTVAGGHRKTIDVMTVAELKGVIGGFATPSAPRVPIDELVQGVRHKIAGLDVATDTLIDRKSEVDPDVAQDLRDRLVELVSELEGAFAM